MDGLMTQSSFIPGFLGLEIPPRPDAPQRARMKPASMTDLSPEEWRVIALAECPETRRTMAEMILRPSPGAGKAPPCRAR